MPTSFAGRNKLGERLIKPCLVEDHNDAPQNHGYFGPGSPLRRPLIFVGAPDNSDYRNQKYPAVKFSFGQRPRNPLKIELRNWVRKEIGPIASPNLIQFAPGLPKDFNVVPTDADIYPTKSYAKNALVQPEPRALFRRLLDQGWIDAIRTLHPDEPMYTFWDYMRNRWERDAGLRLDHLLLNPKAAKRLVDAGVDREARGLEGASDHAPAWIVLSDKATARRKAVRQSKEAAHRDRRGKRRSEVGAGSSSATAGHRR